MNAPLVIDNFAGGGGASTGIEAALGGAPIDIAINHSPAAVAMHRANHPRTKHYCESIWEVDPAKACDGRPVDLAWFSPDCTHFSRAKGTQPLKKEIRGLAWVVIDWARAVRPNLIFLENVEEFQTWGPLDEDTGRPIARESGATFRDWLEQLRALGYAVEWRSLVAADFGAPTTRRRLFLIARRDGQPIVWPESTHGKGRARPHRAAHEIIDWHIPVPSIFGRRRPLAEATLQRIAKGIERYVIDPKRVEPFVIRHGHYSTITGAGLREGCGAGTFRGQSLRAPLATICATNDKHLVVPFITKFYKGVVGHGVERPIGTITAWDHHALSTATFVKGGADHSEELRAFITKFYGTSTGSSLQLPLPTVTAGGDRGGGHLGLVTVHGDHYQVVDIGMRMLQPHELFAGQGFPSDYIIAPELDGKPLTKTAQIKLAGNSVCPDVAEALVAANRALARAVAS
jgi:DNA (cytosine-5)-methyltransferase 1